MVDLIQTRRSLGLSQEEMAIRADLSKSIIVDAEGAKLKPSSYPSTLRKLADAYGVTIDEIREECEAKESVPGE